LSRRALLVGGAGASLVGTGLIAWLRSRGYEVDVPDQPVDRGPPTELVPLSGPPFDVRAREALLVLYALLLPGDPARGLPGADDAGVFAYVERAARIPGLRPLRDDLLKLARFLDGQAAPARFAELDVARQTQLLLAAQADQAPTGRFVPARALEAALRLGLEGYLGHPHHGGNRAFAAWEALDIPMPRERDPLAGGHHHGGHGE
jgi:hypothetical protein